MKEINPLGMTKEEYIKAALPYEKMKEGIGIRPQEQLEEVPEIPEKNRTFWYFNESESFFFETEEAARKCLPFIYYSSWGGQPKKLEGGISSKQFYDDKTLNKYKEIIEETNRIKKANEDITYRLSVYDSKVKNLVNNLTRNWEFIEEDRLLRIEIQNTYNEFLELTDGDSDKAFEYLLKVFKDTDHDLIAAAISTDIIKELENDSNIT